MKSNSLEPEIEKHQLHDKASMRTSKFDVTTRLPSVGFRAVLRGRCRAGGSSVPKVAFRLAVLPCIISGGQPSSSLPITLNRLLPFGIISSENCSNVRAQTSNFRELFGAIAHVG